jgi:hypothetical protein
VIAEDDDFARLGVTSLMLPFTSTHHRDYRCAK